MLLVRPIVDEMPECAFGHGAAADVAEADEEDGDRFGGSIAIRGGHFDVAADCEDGGERRSTCECRRIDWSEPKMIMNFGLTQCY